MSGSSNRARTTTTGVEASSAAATSPARVEPTRRTVPWSRATAARDSRSWGSAIAQPLRPNRRTERLIGQNARGGLSEEVAPSRSSPLHRAALGLAAPAWAIAA